MQKIEAFNNIMRPTTLTAGSAEDTVKTFNDLAQRIKEAYSLEKAFEFSGLTRLNEGTHTIEFIPPEIHLHPDGLILISPFTVNLDRDDPFGPAIEVEASASPKTLEVLGLTTDYKIVEHYSKKWDQVDILAISTKDGKSREEILDTFQAFEAADADSFVGWMNDGFSMTMKVIRKKDVDMIRIGEHICYVSDIRYEINRLETDELFLRTF